jgi:hypothetical protein
MANAFPIIDADAHVIETERTWDYLDSTERNYRPKLFSTSEDPTRQYWVIDDKIAGFRFLTLSERELHEFAQRARNRNAAGAVDDVDHA